MTDYRHDIEKYLKGQLTPAERNALERKALHDPFLADALEGAEQMKAADFLSDVAALNKKIAGKKTVTAWMWSVRIAASLVIIAVSTFIVWNALEQTEPAQDLALQKSEPASSAPASTDSITTGALSSTPKEQPTAGPVATEKNLAKRSTAPAKTEAKPKPATGGKPALKNEPDAVAMAEAEKIADEIKVTEPIAEAGPTEKAEEVSRAKADDDQKSRLAQRDTDKKKAAKEEAAPTRAYGFAAAPENIIQGKVTSAEDGSPLPGVNVVIKGSTLGTATDAAGNYQITVNESNPTLVYSFIGLQNTEIEVKDKKELNVKLANDASQLSEVVVTGYGYTGTGKEVTVTVDLAHPETGNRAFKQHLEKNMRYPDEAKTKKIEGRVTVEFTVEPDGSLSNFNIVRGIGFGCDEELIRLIKEGPKWSPTMYNKVPVQDKAKVRLKFELPK